MAKLDVGSKSQLKDFAKDVGKNAKDGFNAKQTGKEQGKAAAKAQQKAPERKLLRSGSAQAMAFNQRLGRDKIARKQLSEAQRQTKVQREIARNTKSRGEGGIVIGA
jgi:hypothetical protein